jgi:hypothetical protein
MVHGRLYLNNQRARFMEIEPMCTFCIIREKENMKMEGVPELSPEFERRLRALDRETTSHIFWDCRIVRDLVSKVINYLCNTRGRGIEKGKYMMGCETENKRETEFVLLIVHVIKYGIYKCKHRRVIPTFASLRYEVEEFVGAILRKQRWRESIRDISGVMERILTEL